jgi:hypothetical protein
MREPGKEKSFLFCSPGVVVLNQILYLSLRSV